MTRNIKINLNTFEPPPLYFKGEIEILKEEGEDEKKEKSIFDPIIRNYHKIISHFNNIIITKDEYDELIKHHKQSWWPLNDDIFINIFFLSESLIKKSLLDLNYVAKNIFNLSVEAIDNILKKQSSLLYQVSISEKDNQNVFYKIKSGVYYMLQRGTVIKFLTNQDNLSDFFLETIVGSLIHVSNGKIEGAVGVKACCPEGLCVEMDFAGISLHDILFYNNYYCHYHKHQQRLFYTIKMLQITNQISNKYISSSSSIPIIINNLKKKFLTDLPYVFIYLINQITNLSRHGILNADLKLDNIVINGATGQPKMIDFGLVIPAGEKYRLWDNNKEPPSPSLIKNILRTSYHVAPEFIKGEKCEKSIMTFSLCHMFSFIFRILYESGDYNKNVKRMYENEKLMSFLKNGLNENPNNRPVYIHLMAFLITDCFNH